MSSQEGSSKDSKTLYYVGGALVVIAGAGFLYYTLKSDTKGVKKEVTKKKKVVSVDPKLKYKRRLNNRFDNLNVCPGVDGKACYFTSDPMNEEQKIKVGSRLIKINGEKCANWTYKKILEKIQICEVPITAEFIGIPENETNWKKAEECKLEANRLYKDRADPDNFTKAIAKYSEAIDLHETRKEYYSNRVLCYFNQDHHDLALHDVEKFDLFDPNGTWQKGFHLKGLTYAGLNKNEEALESFKNGILIDPSSKWGKKMSKRVDDISKN